MSRDGNCELWCQYVLKDLNGKLRKKKTFKSKSFVKAFIQMLYLLLSAKGTFGATYSMLDTSNTSRTMDHSSIGTANSIVYMSESASTANFGTFVGTGTAAVTMDDVALATKIAHGSSAGTLQYSAVTFGAPATTTTETSLRVTRVFTNASGGSIGINETGIAIRGADSAGTNRYFLAIRDVLPSTVTVNNSEQLTVNYTIKTII